MKKNIWLTIFSYLLPSLVLCSALSIAGTAAYFSIIGLTALFPGALAPIILMGVVLECGKLLGALWLHQNWAKSPRFMRYYLTFAVVVLMGITSIGIFGFLAKSHLEHQKDALQEKAAITQLNDKINFEQKLIVQHTSNIDKLNTQISSFNSFKKEDIQTEEKLLQEIYKNLENGIKIEQGRIVSLTARFGELEAERLVIQNGSSFSKRSKLEKLTEQQAPEREEIKNKTREANVKIDGLRQQSLGTKDQSLEEIDKYNASISVSQKNIDSLNNEKFKLGDKLRAIEVEVGPIKYVAELLSSVLGKEIPLGTAVKTLIMSIIFVFDPLAVLLLLASTSTLRFKFMSAHEKLKAVAKWG